MLTLIKNLLKASSLLIATLITFSIAFLSLMKLGKQPISFNHLDKIEHAIAYASLSFFWLLAFDKNIKKQLLILLSCILYGILLEILQGTTSYRTFDYMDMIANTIGISIGYLLFCILIKEKNIVK